MVTERCEGKEYKEFIGRMRVKNYGKIRNKESYRKKENNKKMLSI